MLTDMIPIVSVGLAGFEPVPCSYDVMHSRDRIPIISQNGMRYQ